METTAKYLPKHRKMTVHRATLGDALLMTCGATVGRPGHTGWLSYPDSFPAATHVRCTACWGVK